VLLVGEELEAHQQEQERLRREREEAEQRKRREEEIALLAQVQAEGAAAAADGDDDDDDDGADDENQPGQARAGSKRRKLAQPSKIAKFLEPSFPMFETRETVLATDDYGAANDDLVFQDITAAPSYIRPSRPTAASLLAGAAGGGAVGASTALTAAGPGGAAAGAAGAGGGRDVATDVMGPLDSGGPADAPWKLVGIKGKVQFACAFTDVVVSGRADFKAIKTVVTKLAPARVLLLRGSEADCEAVAAFVRGTGATAYVPGDRETVAFRVETSRVRLQIPQALLPPGIRVVRGQPSGSGGGGGSGGGAGAGAAPTAQVCAISGRVVEVAASGKGGIRVMRLQPPLAADASSGGAAGAAGAGAAGAGVDEVDADGDEMQVEGEQRDDQDEDGANDDGDMAVDGDAEGGGAKATKPAPAASSSSSSSSSSSGGAGDEEEEAEEAPVETDNALSVGVVSVGEVLLNQVHPSLSHFCDVAIGSHIILTASPLRYRAAVEASDRAARGAGGVPPHGQGRRARVRRPSAHTQGTGSPRHDAPWWSRPFMILSPSWLLTALATLPHSLALLLFLLLRAGRRQRLRDRGAARARVLGSAQGPLQHLRLRLMGRGRLHVDGGARVDVGESRGRIG